VAGSTTVGITVTEATQVAMGWSVKKGILGKTIYNEAGDRIGKVIDLIISPDRNVSYVIVGAGGFIGFGRHDVAIPVKQIQDNKVMKAGAIQDPAGLAKVQVENIKKYLDGKQVVKVIVVPKKIVNVVIK
jgi:sporulation protein YlmC with PRC-barrel domain